jgi:pyridoxamine 5'-phosphate oxidase like protein
LPLNEKHEDNVDRVWDIIEKVGVTMLTTQFSGGLRARPLEARPERDAGLIWFVTDIRSGKEHEIDWRECAILGLWAHSFFNRGISGSAVPQWWLAPLAPSGFGLGGSVSRPFFGAPSFQKRFPRNGNTDRAVSRLLLYCAREACCSRFGQNHVKQRARRNGREEV